MQIKERKDFSDINVEEIHVIPYDIYEERPRCTDFKYGENRSIILRNKMSGELEKINFKFIGSMPFDDSPGCYWYWGQIEADGPNCCLTFYFEADGSLRSVSASFCAKSPSHESFKRMNEKVSYPAEIMKMGPL